MSYVTDPSPSRASIDAPQNTPIPQFDFHLKVISDSYLSFFNERRRIEEIYIESMLKLYKRTQTIDIYLDDRPDRTTVRAAWGEIRDNVERETNARQAFLSALNEQVIGPLTVLKDSQDRIRKRIKEESKDSTSAHTDFAENQLPKLKRAYLRKCQETEDHKASAAAQSANSSQAPVFADGQRLPDTAPQSFRPMERKASLGSSSRARSRSPPAGDRPSLSDLAYQGKRQLNQLMTFLDKGSTVKDGPGGRIADSSLKMVRAKREADDADKEYRKGIYRLETLRLRRVKTLRAGYTSLERFYLESAETVKKALQSFTDNLHAATSTQSALAQHARKMVEQVVPAADCSILSAQLPRLLEAALPPQIYYHNYFVGECRDLSFGLSLADYQATRGLPEGDVPRIIRLCINEVEARGLSTEGIYRISGRQSTVSELQHKLERDEAHFSFNPATDDVHSIASLLKAYLRSLPEPLFKFSLQERLQHSEEIDDHILNDFVVMKSKIRRLPPVHRHSLKLIVQHLASVASHASKNRMDSKNLAIVFGTVIFGEDDMVPGSDLLAVSAAKDTVMEDLIEHADILFQPDDRDYGGSSSAQQHTSPAPVQQLTQPQSPVAQTRLPAQPHPNFTTTDTSGKAETITVYSGPSVNPQSASRQSMDDLPLAPAHNPAIPDFTPVLPPRPANSIHPSARKLDAPLPPSPTRARPTSTPPPPTGETDPKISPARSRPSNMPPPGKSAESVISLDPELAGVAAAAMAFTEEEVAQASVLDNAPQKTITGRGSRPTTPVRSQFS